MNQGEVLDQVHIIIHSIRLIENYKSSIAEQKIGELIRNYYTSCPECKAISDNIKNNPTQKKLGMFERIKSAMGES